MRQQDERREARKIDPQVYGFNSFNLGSSHRRGDSAIEEQKIPTSANNQKTQKVEDFGSSGISFSDIQLELFKEIPLNKESIISEMEILKNKDA